MKTYTLKIIEIIQQTSDTISIRFKQPSLKKISYSAGQYLTLIFRINGRRYLRPYSFSSSPGIDPYLEITVKRVTGGIVSNHIIDVLRVGDSIETLPPMGDFVVRNTDATSIFLWGVGSGVTPLMSLAKYLLSSFPHKRTILIYGNRSTESTIFLNAIQQLEEKYPLTFKTWHFHTFDYIEKPYLNIINGRIDPNTVLQITGNLEMQNTLHYICGPLGLKTSVKSTLQNANVPKENIYSEDFEVIRNPEDFKDIATRNIKLIFEGKENSLEIVKGKNILEVALDTGIELPYSCQTGNCDTCKGFLKAGELRMIGLSETRKDLKPDEYLMCCSYPLNDNVIVEI